MNTNDKHLLLNMMEDHADTLGNAGCNDWEWPESWNEGYKRDFLERFNEWHMDHNNKDGNSYYIDYDKTYGPPDFLVWAFLTHQVKEAIK